MRNKQFLKVFLGRFCADICGHILEQSEQPRSLFSWGIQSSPRACSLSETNLENVQFTYWFATTLACGATCYLRLIADPGRNIFKFEI